MKIGIINYGAGNLKSVANALQKIDFKFEIFSDPKKADAFDKLILPGVGSAAFAMQNLNESGFADVIKVWSKPFLGICLGLQVLADFSQEGNAKCLEIIPGNVCRFQSDLKIPQIGWNSVNFVQDALLFEGISNLENFYFVNSFYLKTDSNYELATTNYGQTFSSVIQKDNFYATQFHPEKSGESGLKLLFNFCKKC